MSLQSGQYDRGKIVASILSGSWLSAAPRPRLSPDELESVAPLLLGSGAGALGWNCIRDTDLAESWAAHELRQAYRMHTLQAAVHELRIKQALTFFRSMGVEPILVKGWVIARDYPEMGLRPYGDLDLCVPAGEFHKAEAAMLSAGLPDCPVDLHEGFTKLDLASEQELYGRSVAFALRDVTVRTLSNEDHFRLLCVHLLRHGAWRPLWLCDIAAALSALQRLVLPLTGTFVLQQTAESRTGLAARSASRITC